MALSKEELIAGLASLSPGERAALMGSAPPTVGTPKMQPAIKAVPADKIADACKAIIVCLRAQARPAEEGGGEAGMLKAFDSELRAKFPELADAMRRNSDYRRKPLGHSLNAGLIALQLRETDADASLAERVAALEAASRKTTTKAEGK